MHVHHNDLITGITARLAGHRYRGRDMTLGDMPRRIYSQQVVLS